MPNNPSLLENLKKHYRQMAPHVAERQTGQFLMLAIEEIEALQKENAQLKQSVSGRPEVRPVGLVTTGSYAGRVIPQVTIDPVEQSAVAEEVARREGY